MNAKMIVILMMVVLVCLFIWSRFFRRKEVANNKLEIASFEAIKKFQLHKNDENKTNALNALVAVSLAHGFNEDQARQKAQSELAKFEQ